MKIFLPCLLCILMACSGGDRSAGKRVLNIPLFDDINSLDPAKAYDTVSQAVTSLTLESLYQYKYTKLPLEITPHLAEALPEISADQKTYTIKIKRGVNWQDDPSFSGTRELKAQDFIYAWKRILLPEIQSPGTWMFEHKVVGWDEYKKQLLANREKVDELLQQEVPGLRALDDYTLQIRLVEPYPQLLYILAMGLTAPIAQETVKKYGQLGFNDRMIGTGPFRLAKFVRGSTIVLEKNPTFHGENYPSDGDENAKTSGLLASAGKALPFVETVNFHIIKEDQPRWLQFLKGNLDESGIPKDSFDSAISDGRLRKELVDKGILLFRGENPSTTYLGFNMKDSIVGGKHDLLRKAFSAAINRDVYIQKFLNGRGIKATSLIPRVVNGNTGRKEISNDFNLDEAKKLLAKAGYPEGKGLPIIRFDLSNASTSSRQVAEYIQKSLEVIGIKIEIIVNTFPAYLQKQSNGNLQFFLRSWVADFPDAENFLFLFATKNSPPGPNTTSYSNAAFDSLYEKTAKMPHSPARMKLIQEAEDVLLKDAPIILMNYPLAFTPYHGWLKNFRPNSLITNQIKYFDIDTENRVRRKEKL